MLAYDACIALRLSLQTQMWKWLNAWKQLLQSWLLLILLWKSAQKEPPNPVKYLLNWRKVSPRSNWAGLHYGSFGFVGRQGKRAATLTALTKLNKAGGTDPTFLASNLVCCLLPFTWVRRTGLEQNPNKNISNALLFGCFCETMSGFF